MARSSGVRSAKRRAAMRPRSAYLSRSAVCALGGITEHQLLVWESEELVTPAAVLQVEGNSEPVYDDSALRRIRTIRALDQDLGVNLPGISVILHLLDRLSGQSG